MSTSFVFSNFDTEKVAVIIAAIEGARVLRPSVACETITKRVLMAVNKGVTDQQRLTEAGICDDWRNAPK